MSDDFSLRDAPGHLIRRAQHLHASLWNEEVTADLTSKQFAVLSVLIHADGLDQTAVGAQAGLDKATAAEALKRLEQRRFVVRFRDPEDGRRYIIQATIAGLRAHTEALSGVERVQERLLSGLSPAERDRFVDILKRICFPIAQSAEN